MGSAAPTWMAAYLKRISPEVKDGLGLSEGAAVDAASRAVRNAHGGGGAKDLAAVQSSKGVMSLATMFYRPDSSSTPAHTVRADLDDENGVIR
jgi:hypothetical protein